MGGEGRISTGRGKNLGENSISQDALRKRERCISVSEGRQ